MALYDEHVLGFRLVATEGLHPGTSVQFAEGHWPDEIGVGVAMSDNAFDVIEPHILAISCEWTEQHRYGVFELSVAEAAALVARLRSEADLMLGCGAATSSSKLMLGLATWLEPRCDGRRLSILGY